MTMFRLRATLASVAVCVCAAGVAAAPASAVAASPAPAWSINAVSGPTHLSQTGVERDEVQSVNVRAAGGSFTLSFEGKATNNIACNAPAATVQAELEALSTIGHSNVSVTGGPATAEVCKATHFFHYLVTFTGALADKHLPALIATGALLTGGKASTVTIETPGRGGFGTFAIYPTNVGGAPSSGTITVTDTLPTGLSAYELGAYTLNGWKCTPEATQTRVTCTLTASVMPGLPPASGPILVPVNVGSTAAGVETNQISVTGGGAAPASLAEPVTISSTPAPAGIESFSAGSYEAAGNPLTQAGAHPYAITTAFFVNTRYNAQGEVVPAGNSRDVEVQLPPGLIGDPRAAPQCAQGLGYCPLESEVGTAASFFKQFGYPSANEDVFNLVPALGTPAEFGFTSTVPEIYLTAHVRSDGDYGVTIYSLNTPTFGGFPVFGAVVTFWGRPADPSHNAERCAYLSTNVGCAASNASDTPLLTNPTDCARQALEPPAMTLLLNSWENPAFDSRSVALAPVGGCAHVPFAPTLRLQPSTQAAGSPTGLDADLHMPQLDNAEGISEAQLRDAVVTLPAGMVVSPSSANGLGACSPAQIGLVSDSPVHFNLQAPTCPDSSKLGTVEIQTPLLEKPLDGAIYLAEQSNNPFHSLLAIYLAVDDPATGIVIKLAGHVEANAQTGQLTTTFDEDPQLPFSDLKLHFKQGARAPLLTPSACGTYTTTTSLTPWSAPESGPPATPSDSFQITSGPGGTPCAAQGFAPSFTAGTVNNQAGGFSPFTLTLSRQDGEQALSTVATKMPPGLAGMLAKVALCGEAQANAGSCPAASQIGHVTVTAGAGSDPITLPQAGRPQDPVYLTGPYKGAPFGLSIVVPAEAGPFNLGTVVVRAKVEVDPHTAQVSVLSDPMPYILQGILVDVRSINVTVDREGFMFNPTSCSPLSVAGTITSTQGAAAAVSNRFQASECRSLPFKPKFQVSTSAKHSRKNGASLHVVVQSGAGQANIGSVKVNLPKQLPSRQSTLKLACLAAVFNANPAACPAGSKVGGATAYTPVLPVALKGPAYFVSHGGAAFPDLVVVLQGDGVTVELTGNTFISKAGITSSTFRSVPDVPITRFDLVLPTGAHSALAGNGSFCTGAMHMPTQIKGQNGAVVKQSTKIAVSGCPKAVKKGKKGAGPKK